MFFGCSIVLCHSEERGILSYITNLDKKDASLRTD